jgi:hypothetical protein
LEIENFDKFSMENLTSMKEFVEISERWLATKSFERGTLKIFPELPPNHLLF